MDDHNPHIDRFAVLERHDPIQNPAHYTKGFEIQRRDLMMANNPDCCRDHAIKYLSRWRTKGGVEDLYKAQEYMLWLFDAIKEDLIEGGWLDLVVDYVEGGPFDELEKQAIGMVAMCSTPSEAEQALILIGELIENAIEDRAIPAIAPV